MVCLKENFLHDLPDSARNHCEEIEGTHPAAPIILIIKGILIGMLCFSSCSLTPY